MLALFLRSTQALQRLRRGAAIAAACAALGGTALCCRAPRDTGGEGARLDPARRSEFWDRPQARCLRCHRRGDYRIDPSRRTAYAMFTADSPARASEADEDHVPVIEPRQR